MGRDRTADGMPHVASAAVVGAPGLGRLVPDPRDRDALAGRCCVQARRGVAALRTLEAMSTHRANVPEEQHLGLPVEELLRRARPLPPHDEMVIEELGADEGEAFVLAVGS